MLALLSPAKSLDYATPVPTRKSSQPRLLEQASELIEVMRTRSVQDVAALMNLSDELATLNVERYQDFSPPFTRRNARAAVFAFAGDTYIGLDASRLDERDLTEAQKTVRILSGLYGVLRPLDLIQPYRLEMGTRLATERGASLYDWWGGQLADVLRDDLAASPGPPLIVNCASAEYAKAGRLDTLGARVVTPRFEDADQHGTYRVVSFFAKRARGAYAAWMVTNRVRTASALTRFDDAGYRYVPEVSSPDEPVFRRTPGA